MFPTRRHLELFVVAIALAALLGTVASRMLTMADHTQHRALTMAGAYFIAGIEMLQAESRLDQHRKLNAVGYPTGRSGVLSDDADCELIWQQAMRASEPPAASRFVADSDGGGDRCEYLFVGTAADTSMRILYWPLGVGAATVALGRDVIRVTRGTHVHVALGQVSS
jgi:hypothetical protein